MERFWNIIHFFAYQFFTKFYLFLMRIDPILNIVYKTDWAKKHFEKMGKDPVKEVKFALTDKRIGQSSWFAGLLMLGIPLTILMVSLYSYFRIFNNGKLPSPEIYIFLLVVLVSISSLFNYFLLFRHDKYIRYFKKFEKQPRKWKVKWAWISSIFIAFPFIVVISTIIISIINVKYK